MIEKWKPCALLSAGNLDLYIYIYKHESFYYITFGMIWFVGLICLVLPRPGKML